MRNAGADQPRDSEDVDVDMAADDRVAAAFEREGMVDRGIGDDDIDAAEPVDRLGHRGVHGVGNRDVARQGEPRRSEEHTSELPSLMRNSYAVFCLKNKTLHNHTT